MRCKNIKIHAVIPVEIEGGIFTDENKVKYSEEAIRKACEKADSQPILQFDRDGKPRVIGISEHVQWNPKGFVEVDGSLFFGGTDDVVNWNENVVAEMKIQTFGATS